MKKAPFRGLFHVRVLTALDEDAPVRPICQEQIGAAAGGPRRGEAHGWAEQSRWGRQRETERPRFRGLFFCWVFSPPWMRRPRFDRFIGTIWSGTKWDSRRLPAGHAARMRRVTESGPPQAGRGRRVGGVLRSAAPQTSASAWRHRSLPSRKRRKTAKTQKRRRYRGLGAPWVWSGETETVILWQ